ncbi:MAG: hypothetical protein AAFW73_19045 [Bacteroidota bacterium]
MGVARPDDGARARAPQFVAGPGAKGLSRIEALDGIAEHGYFGGIGQVAKLIDVDKGGTALGLNGGTGE